MCEYLVFDKSEQLTCLVLELVSNQNAIGLQRFVPFEVNGVETSTVNPEEPRSIRHCKEKKQERDPGFRKRTEEKRNVFCPSWYCIITQGAL